MMINKKTTLNPARWLDEYGNYLFRYALMRVRDSAIAEDILQETLLAAFSSSQSHAGLSSERSWLVGIMKHKVVDYFRQVGRMTQFQLITDDGRERVRERWTMAGSLARRSGTGELAR
jgi:RNA polymerase sigma-70 factor (ECF subfamily)